MPKSTHRRNHAARRTARASTTSLAVLPRRKIKKLHIMASAVIAVLVIGSFALIGVIPGNGPKDAVLGSAQAYVDGVGTRVVVMPSKDHVDSDSNQTNDIVEYNSVPATSGDHWSVPSSCGFYDFEIPEEEVVHNLEHSNIVISYNLESQEDVDSLRKVFDGLGAEAEQFSVAYPNSKIAPGQVALSAWGVYDLMDGVDKDRIERFFDHYLGKLGPEGAISCLGQQESMLGS